MIKNNRTSEMTLGEHFSELRKRAIFSLLFFFASFLLCYFFAKEIYQFLLEPFIEISKNNQNRKLIYTSPTEAFITYLKLSFYCGLFLSLPIFISEIYLFLSPALYKNEKKNIITIFLGTTFLFFCGAIFAFIFILPIALEFFASFENQGFREVGNFPIILETKISDYLNFVLSLIFGFGLAFILPILLLFLIKAGFLSVNDLRSKRRYCIVLIFILSAILTPPDVLSQASLAILLILLFEIVILIGKNLNK